MRCSCGRKMREAEVEFAGFRLKGFKCECGEEALNPWDVELVRQLKHEPIKARKVANSLVITLPKPLAKLARISAGDKLRWRVSGNQLILEK